jgi:O-antigen/teichoic acid export membrane protein
MKFHFEIFRKKISKWNKDDFLLHSAITLAGTKLGDVFNLLYRLAMARLLSVGEYGVFNTLISFLAVAVQFLSPFQPAFTRFIAERVSLRDYGGARSLVRRSQFRLLIFAALILVLFWVAAAPISSFFRLERPGYVALVGLLLSLAIAAAVPSAVLQGTQQFTALAAIAAASPLAKLALGTALVLAGTGIFGALAGFVAGSLFILVAAAIVMTRNIVRWPPASPSAPPVSLVPVIKYCVPTSVVLGSFWALTTIDIFLVKRFFTPEQAGYYSLAQMVGMIILFLPGAISLVVFPKATSAQARRESSGHLLFKGILIAGAICGACTAACALFPETTLRILAGRAEEGSIPLVGFFALAMSFYALASITLMYHLAVRRTAVAVPVLVLAAAEAAVIWLRHPSLAAVVRTVAVFAVVTFGVSLAMLRLPRSNGSDRSDPSDRSDQPGPLQRR